MVCVGLTFAAVPLADEPPQQVRAVVAVGRLVERFLAEGVAAGGELVRGRHERHLPRPRANSANTKHDTHARFALIFTGLRDVGTVREHRSASGSGGIGRGLAYGAFSDAETSFSRLSTITAVASASPRGREACARSPDLPDRLRVGPSASDKARHSPDFPERE